MSCIPKVSRKRACPACKEIITDEILCRDCFARLPHTTQKILKIGGRWRERRFEILRRALKKGIPLECIGIAGWPGPEERPILIKGFLPNRL